MVTDVVPLMAESHRGSSEAFHLLEVINYTLAKVQTATPRSPAICACCSGPLKRRAFAFVVAKPANKPDATHSLALVICARCGNDRETVRAAGVRALKDVWPEARPITVTHAAGGRA